MTHLNIQQDLNILELVTTKLIQKLYDNVLSIPKPSGKNPDNAYMSGKLEVPKAYKSQVLYLAGNINGEPNASGRFPDLRIDVTNSYYIVFEDPEVASVLLSTVSTDGIGVSEGDASLVTSFSTLGLSNHSSITSFDELKYFANITSIPQGALDGTDNITKINLKNISTLGQSSLAWKTQLSNVGLTTNLRTVGKFAFMNDSSLHNIDLTGVTTIELEAFRGTGITDVNCPSLLNLNGSGNFQMSSVQTITDLGSVTILPDSAFWKCTSLTSADISNVVTIKNGVFNGCSSLNSINLSNVTSIGNNAFNGCNITGPIDLSNVTSIGENAFYGCNLGAVTLPNITSLTHRSFNNCGVTSFDISGSSITNIALLNLVTGNQLTSVKLPTTVTTFGSIYGPTFNSNNITELRGVLGITTVYSSSSNNILNPLPLLNLLTSDMFILTLNMALGLVFTASCPQAYLPVFKYCTKTTIEKPSLGGYNDPQNTFFQNYTNRKMPIELLYFKDLEYIRPFMFYGANVKSLVINNTTCPTFNTTGMTYTNLLDTLMSDFTDWSTKPFGNMSIATMTIYVPNNAVSTYQADSNYNSYTILGIGSLNSGVIYATESDWVTAGKPIGLIAEYLGLNTADLATFVSENNLTYYTPPSS